MSNGRLCMTNQISVGCGMRVDHATNTVLAYVFGKQKDEVFKKLKELLEPFGVERFYRNKNFQDGLLSDEANQ